MEELKQYTLPGGRIYLDNAATRLMSEESMLELIDLRRQYPGNVSSNNASGKALQSELERSKSQIAQWCRCLPNNLTFTSGSTEAINLIIWNQFRRDGGRIVVFSLDHPAIVQSAKFYGELGADVMVIPGVANIDAIEGEPYARDGILVVSHVHSETGTSIDLHELSVLCKERELNLVVDVTQSMGKFGSGWDLGSPDFIVGSAHKMGGVQGLGILVDYEGLLSHALIHGGAQQKGLRSGTINAVGIIHWARQWSKHCQKNWHSMWESVNQACFDGLAEKVHVPNACDWIVLARMKPELQDRFRERVDFSNGSACSSGLVSSAYELLFDNPEEIIRLSF